MTKLKLLDPYQIGKVQNVYKRRVNVCHKNSGCVPMHRERETVHINPTSFIVQSPLEYQPLI